MLTEAGIQDPEMEEHTSAEWLQKSHYQDNYTLEG